MLNVMIIHASTREGRQGITVSDWVKASAQMREEFTVDFVDLKELNLPFMDEPKHPKLHQYTQEHTIAWSNRVERADAFIFVTSEYNYGMPAPLKNALDYLSSEWRYKPVGFVGYGGIAGGTRSIQQLKQVTSALRMFPFDGVFLPFFATQFDEKGIFQPTDRNQRALQALFDELLHLGEGMKILR